MRKVKGVSVFVTLYFFILMVFTNGYAGEIPKEFFVPRINLIHSHAMLPIQNTSRFAAAAMVLNFFLEKKISPIALEKYSDDLRTMAGAAKVFKKLIGHAFYDTEAWPQNVHYVLSLGIPVFFEYDHGSFVTLVGYNQHGFFINDPENPRKVFLDYQEIRFVSPMALRFAVAWEWVNPAYNGAHAKSL